MSEANLEILASRAGLAVDWIDANGRPQRVTADALRAVLKGLGHPADNDAQVDASLLELEQVQQDKHLPPLMTVDSGDGLDLGHFFAGFLFWNGPISHESRTDPRACRVYVGIL